jgi:hypothetical protein
VGERAASDAPDTAAGPPRGLDRASATLTRAARSPVAVLGAYAFLAVAITFPLATDPAGLLAGGARSDAPNSVWGLWFVERALAAGRLPLATGLLDHPHGGRIAVADPLNALLGLPLVAAFGPVAAYGLLVLGHLTFAGVAAHALGRRLGGSGWIAGVGYLLAPIVLSHVQNGSSETIGAGWLPLAMLAVVDAAERGGFVRSARAGLALAVCAMNSGTPMAAPASRPRACACGRCSSRSPAPPRGGPTPPRAGRPTPGCSGPTSCAPRSPSSPGSAGRGWATISSTTTSTASARSRGASTASRSPGRCAAPASASS